ncbi:twin-arginine translocase subunit TatB [Gammaproteobacteria bacterium LSUCC0112]|nr:twin-arginine translocase subunit TatB [Gammaproteobacteria bacterium LSUCC0112]
MFDISFIELLVVFVVALLVLGPEKLPGAVRTGALWIGRAKRSFGKVKAEIEQQLNADDIRRQLHNESIMADIEKARKGADQLVKDTRKELDKTQQGLNKSVSSVLAAPDPTPVAVVTNSAVEGMPTYQPATPSAAPETEAITDAASSDAAVEEAQPEKQPVEDFYNNPASGLVSMKNGKLAAYVPPAPLTEQAEDKKD